MPNLAPPRTGPARRRAARPAAPRPANTAAPAATTAASATGAAASGTSAPGLPASWAGAGALLASVEAALPTPAAVLAAAGLATDRHPVAADLQGLWAAPEATAQADAGYCLRRLDAKGRLPLPVAVPGPARLPAARRGPVLTVYLPGAAEAPAPADLVAALPVDARARLTLTDPVRDAAGLPVGAEVLVLTDVTAGTVTVCPASLLAPVLRTAVADLADPAGPADAAVPTSDSADTWATVHRLPRRPEDPTRPTPAPTAPVSPTHPHQQESQR